MVLRNTASIGGAALVATLSLLGCDRRKPDMPQAVAVAEHEARYAEGAAVFEKYCALCHGHDASGYAADHAPSLVSTTFLESASDELIARGIREGRVNTAMAGYARARGGPLDEGDVTAIITFLRDRGPPRLTLSKSPMVGDAARGEVVYEANCKRCHGTRTEVGNSVHLADAALLSAASDAFLRHAVVHGRPGTPMPAFEGALSSADIDNVVTALRSWAAPVSPERRTPPEAPLGPVVINPEGKTPEFTLREDRFVPIDQVKRALELKQRIVIIDARASSDWFLTHIPGSISVPYYLFTRLDALPKDGTWITAYCACPHHASGVVIDELRKRGFTHTAVLDEGILEWKKRNYPTDTEPLPPDPGGAMPAPLPSPAPARPRISLPIRDKALPPK